MTISFFFTLKPNETMKIKNVDSCIKIGNEVFR
jgi:hypothetical protein